MPVRDTNWPHGSPCWAEAAFEPQHRGMHHARDFYEKLFGWRTVEGDKDSGGYVTCLKDERAAAGLSVMPGKGERPVWTTFFATDDVDASVSAVQQAGGTVQVAAADAGGLGRMAFCTDPGGARFALWQAGVHKGFGIVAEPGSVAWNTLLTRDLAAAQAFYSQIFGWVYQERAADLSMASLADGAQVAGLHQADQLDENVSDNWLIHFEVADRDSSAQIAQNLDAEVLMTSDSPMGPEALLRGKGGEILSIIQITD